jgi:hypothetical protein
MGTVFSSFFVLAGLSPSRQRAFRQAVVAHLLVLAGGVGVLMCGQVPVSLLGHLLLVLGIVEGAALVGWRLTQLPKSQALEFLLVSSLQPRPLFVAEALVGLCRLGLVTLTGLPVLILLVMDGYLEPADPPILLTMSFTWGTVTALGLTAWAYESRPIRRWMERGMLALIVSYLGIGLVAGEHVIEWITWLPAEAGRWFLNGFEAFHRYNPFAVVEFWLAEDTRTAWDRTLGLEAAALVAVGVLLVRAAGRLQGHFHDRHYSPVQDACARRHERIGDWPLSWWAVRRVREFSGRINLWLAGGFGSLYALYIVAQAHWPPWMGQRVFEFFDRAGGIPVLTTVLVILAAVPAAFQYGLWDSSTQDRCRRLELLLLTRLEALDYWKAAAAAAWQRGRGYFGVAVLLWLAAVWAGRITAAQGMAALSAGVLLWGLYFALGFRAFSRGIQANALGMLLTVGLPLLVFGCHRAGWPLVAGLIPPGSVYAAGAGVLTIRCLLGPLFAGVAALCLARSALLDGESQLRRWYDLNHGKRSDGS